MGMMSKTKGKVGEREVAALLRAHGFEAKRGVQYQGGSDSPDVVHSMDGFHIEVKRSEKLAIEAALEQADDDSMGGDVPTVFHRKNNKTWVVIMYATDFIEMVKRNREKGGSE